LLVGMQRIGNTIQLPDGEGQLWIAAACSSLANLSLTILCWTLFAQHVTTSYTSRMYWAGLTACCAVISINICRLSLMALFPDFGALIHGPVGSFTIGWLTTIAMVGICFLGFRRELGT
jgi:hypothetical protein